MSIAQHPSNGAEQQVTASELVRHFGVWQERAARAPVYILHRGRPRLVLTSLDVMDALCAPHARDGGTEREDLPALLDADDGVTIAVSREGHVRLASRGARARFGGAVAPGASIEALTHSAGSFLTDAIRRVAGTGMPESIELEWRRYAGRRKLCRIAPFPNGCLITASDLDAAEELHALRRHHAALCASAEAAGLIEIGITLRGHVAAPTAALARITGVAPDALAGTRFASLFDVADRVAIGEAIDRAIRTSSTERIQASLLSRGARSQAVAIGLSPVVEAGQVTGLIATTVASSGG